MTDAALAWLDSLDDAQRADAVLPWPSNPERLRWHYTPVDHGGLHLGRMRPRQQSLAHQLLATGLSRAGYVTAATVIGLENILDHLEEWRVTWDRERGRDPELYWMRVFGDPASAGPWSWRFGGHHLSVHHVVADGEVRASSPCFLGADPAQAPLLGGHLLRPLGAAEDLARDLVRSLDAAQRAVVVLSPHAPNDILSGEQPRALVPVEGLPAAELDPGQREQLRALLDVFLGRIPEELAARETARFAGDRLLEVRFAWAGGLERGEPHYYRLQGPRLLAEYDNSQRDANHIHTVWRDPENDFGEDALAHHRALFH
ncbi:DUF3500 domain-containing protein [Cryptosporangium sp. NPDC051539]|uniref:DUF3500 domain-containing protein n=1 Tax=Cryptosporangium sp. NPDC051539 TaxID=3363962 RepID=UPI0037A72E5E